MMKTKTLLLSGVISILFIAKVFSQAPGIEWQKTIGSTSSDLCESIQQTSDGGYILGGNSNANFSGTYDYLVLKLNSTGAIQWQNTLGGDADDFLSSIKQTSDGGYILGGYSKSGISGIKTEANLGASGTSDYWVIKLNSSGILEWQNTIGGSDNDYLYSIQQTTDGGFILGGSSYSSISGDKAEANQGTSSSPDYWVVKLNSSGIIEWQNTIGGDDFDNLSSIEQTTDGGYILGGTSYSDLSGDKTDLSFGYWVIKLDNTGIIEWQNAIGGDVEDDLRSIQQTSDGGYILGGDSYSGRSGDKTEINLGEYNDYWVVKLNNTGAIEWQNTIGGFEDEYLYSIQQTSDGGYILGGYSDSYSSYDKSEALIGGNYDYDFWVIKLNGIGDIEWENTIGGTDYDVLKCVQETSDGGYILGGYSRSDISGDKTQNHLGTFAPDCWVIKLNPDISTNAVISNVSAPLNLFQNDHVNVSYTATGTFNTGNIFTARLFDTLGIPTTIGTLASTTSGTIAVTIPVATPPGTSYRIRVVSSNPVTLGNDNRQNITVNATLIATGVISPLSVFQGIQVNVPFTIAGSFNSGNIFTAQLSNASGSFSSPTAIGTLTSTSSGTIAATIPLSTPVGSGYRIRVVSSSPTLIGSDNGQNITINALSITTNAISPLDMYQNAALDVPYTTAGTFNPGNIFTAQLSNAFGSFFSPIAIGTLTSTTSGTIAATIPASTAIGTSYRIRVVSSNPSIIGSNNGENVIIYGLYISAPTISPLTYFQNDPVNVSYGVPGTFVSGNIFTAQLSNSSGSFSSPTVIGTLSSTTSGNIAATIPVSTPAGTGYRIRVISSNPVRTGSANGQNITVNALTIVTNTISPLTYFQNDPVNVSFTTGTFNSGNVFTAQLSNSTGSFNNSSPAIGTLVSTTSGTIAATIPASTPSGTGYRIRVISSNPSKTGSNNGQNISINGLSIVTNSISPLNIFQNDPVNVSFTTGTFTSGNVFTAQLSNASGSFSSPTAIGTLTSTTSGTIAATIPLSTPAGTAYRIRVVSSNPSLTGSDNGQNITVSVLPCSIPAGEFTSNITATSAQANWNVVAPANQYKVTYYRTGMFDSAAITISNSFLILTNLLSNTQYNWTVQSICTSGNSNQSSIQTFTTPASASIVTNTISPLSFFQSDPVNVSYSATGTFNSGNIFTAQLSNASGSFASPVSIGTLASTNSGTIAATIPLSTPAGSGYRIRVVSSNPSVVGIDNGQNLTVNALACSVASGEFSSNITSASAQTNWTVVTGASQYKVRHRKTGTSTWTAHNTSNNLFNLTGLLSNTQYDWTVQTVCSSGNSNQSSIQNFTTGAVTASIATNVISPLSYFQNDPVNVPFTATGTFNSGNIFTAQLSNSTGSFASPTAIGTLTSTTSGTIGAIIPASTPAGTGYRTRVVSSNPSVVGSANGQNITVSALPCTIPAGEFSSNITSASAQVNWNAVVPATQYKVRYRTSGTTGWTIHSTSSNFLTLTGLLSSTQYDWTVVSVCSGGSSAQSATQHFITNPLRLSLWQETHFEIYPNPLTSFATINFTLSHPSNVTIKLFSVAGKEMMTIVSGDSYGTDESFLEGNYQVEFNRESLAAGIYFLQLKTDESVMTKKVVVD